MGSEDVQVHPASPQTAPREFAPAHPPPLVYLTYAQPVPQARLHLLTLAFAAWHAVRGFVVPALVVIFLRHDVRSLGWVPLAATLGAAAVGWAMVKYFTFSYWVTGGELIIRSGVLARTERHIPLSRVQDVRLKQGPLHRALRVVEVEIETASGEGAEAKLSVLSQAEAQRLRGAIFAERVVTPEALTASLAAAPAVPRQTLRRVTIRELILAGLTSNQVASGLAVVLGLITFADEVMGDRSVYGRRAGEILVAVGKWLNTVHGATWALLAAAGIAALLVIGLVISVRGSVFLFYGFELSVAGEDLHRSYGLFTRHASSLPRRRIQLLRIEEGVLRRMLRLATLRVNSAGSKPHEGEDRTGIDVLLPVVPRDEVQQLLPAIFPDEAAHAEPHWRRVSPRAIWRGMVKASVLCLAVAIVLVSGKGLSGLSVLLLLPAAYAINLLMYRNLGHARDGLFFRTRRGWLSRSTHVMPVRNIQAIILRQNPLDRRHRVGTVQVDTAGQAPGAGGPKVANVPWSEALELARELAHQAARERYRW